MSSPNEFNTLRPRQNGRHFADDILKYIFLNENFWIPIKISLKFVPKGPIDNIPALVQIMAWRRPSDKPLSEPMMVSLTMHICITRPQWVKWHLIFADGIHSSDIIMGPMASQITSLTIVYSTDYSAHIKENIKALRHWPLWGEFIGDPWIPRTKGQ